MKYTERVLASAAVSVHAPAHALQTASRALWPRQLRGPPAHPRVSKRTDYATGDRGSLGGEQAECSAIEVEFVF